MRLPSAVHRLEPIASACNQALGHVPMTSLRLVIWSATSALAGFLFGFDTVVISGAEQTIQALWRLSAGVHGIAMAAALYGTVVGSRVRRLAGRQVRPPADIALDRGALLRLRGVVGTGARTSIRSSSRGSSAGSASGFRPSLRRCTSRRSRPPSSVDVSPACSSSTSSSASWSRSSPTPGSPASATMRGVGCWASRRFPPFCTRLCASSFRKAPAG